MVHRWYSQAKISPPMKNLYSKLFKSITLLKAWKRVQSNARNSDSEKTRHDLEEFAKGFESKLKQISAELKQQSYKFSTATGVPIKRPNKSPRPIVVIPIRDRIVQRALLDVIQSEESVKEYVAVPTSYGGIEGRQVREAIKHVCTSAKDGKKFFIRSDIKNFFTCIPRLDVINTLGNLLPDDSLKDILEEATKTELKNLDELGKEAKIFPSHEIGVAQGYCLSPLFGNILLHNFDKHLNSAPITCLRYIDDFIIVGPDTQSVRRAFKDARHILREFGMDAYEPADKTGKAKEGHVLNGIDFLGCVIYEDFVHPNTETREKLKEKVRNLLTESIQRLKECKFPCEPKFSLIHVMQKINNTLIGWGNQYAFCNSDQIFNNLDMDISKYIDNYLREYRVLAKNLKQTGNLLGLRNILGIHMISRSNSSPILPLKVSDVKNRKQTKVKKLSQNEKNKTTLP